MKILVLVLMAGLLVAGCASYDHSENIGTNAQGNAVGTYSLSNHGTNGDFLIAGLGGSGNGGGGGGALAIRSYPPDINAYNFARAIAMINYSNRLRTIRYDETGGVLEYDFGQGAIGRQSAAPLSSGQGGPSESFGHQPIE
jgi:hypothetical protein